MANTGFTLAGDGADLAGVGTQTWTLTSRIVSSNDSYSVTANIGPGITTHYLRAHSFGFAIPSDATIDGIIARFERSEVETGGTPWAFKDSTVRLIKNGPSVVGDNKADTATEWPTTDTNKDYGSATDLWGTTWTPADINAVGFGVGLSGVSSGDDDGNPRVDTVWIDVYYTEAAGGVTILAPQDSLAETDNVPAVASGASASAPQDTLTITDQAPAINIGVNVAAPQDALTITDNAPGLAATINAPADALTIADQTPTISTGVAVAAPQDTLTIADQTPAVAAGTSVAVPQDTLTITDNAPTIGGGVQINVPADALTITDNAPVVATGVSIPVPQDSLTIADQTPSVASGVAVAAPADALTIADSAPTVAAGASVAAPVDLLTLIDNAPVITATPDAGEARRRAQRQSGRYGRRRPGDIVIRQFDEEAAILAVIARHMRRIRPEGSGD